jgi:hypothetical protein
MAGAADEVVLNDAAFRGFEAQGMKTHVGSHVRLAWFNFAAMQRASERIGNREPTAAELAAAGWEMEDLPKGFKLKRQVPVRE